MIDQLTYKTIARLTKRILLFLAFLGALLASISLLNRYLFNTYHYKVPENTTTVICGPSLLGCGVDPTLLPHSVNVSQSGEMYPMTYIKLREILEQNAEVDEVMIAFSPGMFTRKLERFLIDVPLFQKKIIDRLHPISAPEDYKGWGLEEKNIWQNFFQYYSLPNWSYLKMLIGIKPKKKKSPFPYIGKFRRVPISVLHETEEEVLDQLAIKNSEEGAFSETQLEGVRDIIALCDSFDVRVILIGIPIYQKLIQMCPEDVVIRYKELRTEFRETDNVDVFEMSEYVLPDSMYYDASHLNLYGAQFTTDSLSRWLDTNYKYANQRQ